jgi:hypothetical protein
MKIFVLMIACLAAACIAPVRAYGQDSFGCLVGNVPCGQELPDSPKPKSASEMTRKERDAYLAKKYPDLLHIDTPAKSLKEAATGRGMLAFEGLFLGSVIVDIEGTQHCLAAHTCSEHNPLMGSSRGQQYAEGNGSAAAVILCAAWLRKHQHGSTAVLLLWIPTTVHVMYGVQGFRE